MRNIQMVDLNSQYLDIKEEIDGAIQKVIDSSAFINGPVVKEFANNLALWNNTDYAIPCGNGTDGLQIAIMALDLKPGDEVIVPTFTFISTVEVIALMKLRPVFVDVEYDSFNIDPNELESLITDKTKLIVPVHLFGQCANIEAINTIAQTHNLYVIEDLAQSLGATYKGVKCGNLSSIGVTSFFPSKILGCYGDGGAVFTNDVDLATKIRSIANHGQYKKYHYDQVGVNSRLDTLQAAILNEKLKYLDEYINRRIDAAALYDQNLEKVEGVKIPAKTQDSTHVYHQYTIKVKNNKRDQLKEYLKDHQIPSMIYYPKPIQHQKAYSSYNHRHLPVSEKLSDEVLSLPMHTHLSSDQLKYICDAIISYFNE